MNRKREQQSIQQNFLRAMLRELDFIRMHSLPIPIQLDYYDAFVPSALNFAIAKNVSLPIIEKLVNLGANVHAEGDIDGSYPVHIATMMNRIDVLRFLKQQGAFINVEDQINRSTPLHLAIEEQNIEMIHYLSENGADIEAVDLDGFCPILTGTMKKNLQIIRYLVRLGANINVQNPLTGQTALHLAYEANDEDLIINLLFLGGNPSIVDRNGVSALELARNQKNQALYLILEKAYLNIKENSNPQKPQLSNFPNIEILRRLLG